jgi:hypothetical protein
VARIRALVEAQPSRRIPSKPCASFATLSAGNDQAELAVRLSATAEDPLHRLPASRKRF